jgi:hypothetical protein
MTYALSTASQTLYDTAMQVASNNRSIYQVCFRSGQEPLLALQAGADPVEAVAALLKEQTTSNNPNARQHELALQYLLLCCCPDDIDRISDMIGDRNALRDVSNAFSSKFSLYYQTLTWLETATIDSAEFYDCIVNACKEGDRESLDFWIDKKSVDPIRSIPHFVDYLSGLEFLSNKISLDYEALAEKNYSSDLITNDKDKQINACLKASLIKKIVSNVVEPNIQSTKRVLRNRSF